MHQKTYYYWDEDFHFHGGKVHLRKIPIEFWKRKIDPGYYCGIPKINKSNIKYIAPLFDCSISDLYEITNNTNKFYNTFYIQKHSGKQRKIDAPMPLLKNIQQWILNDILYRIPCSKYAKAYVPGRSITDNTKFHRNQKILLTLDVKDFSSKKNKSLTFSYLLADMKCP